jgi:tRNA nucleotidyltransferase (CCA-adding enzyme)
MSSAYRIDPSLIPDSVCRACAKLKEAGHQAYLVGGAVRDLLRLPEGSGGKDFDLTTSAKPEEVIAVFGIKHTIPTGIAHGTVTVMVAQPGHSPLPVEITTFRGEVGFSDGRRPDRVEFISDLREDLRRRDFTINAIAYDPLDQQLHDCFDGLPDLKLRVLRAVGDPVARFAEDGLRVMRAVRFAAQLEFAVDADTRAAFAGALPTLRKVSRERVRDELQKLLGAQTPSLGLRLMVQRSDAQPEADWGPEGSLLQVALPEVAQQLTPTQARLWMALVDRARPEHRLTALLWPLRRWLTAHPQVLATPRALEELLDERLKLPLAQRQQLTALLSPLPVDQPQHTPRDAVSLRRCAAAHPPELLSQRWTLLALEAELRGDAPQSTHFTQLQQQLTTELPTSRRCPPPS